MNDSLEYPKALYHPKTGEMKIVRDAQQEEEQKADWGIDAPKLQLRSGGVPEGNGDAPKAKAAPKRAAKAAPKAKAAN